MKILVNFTEILGTMLLRYTNKNNVNSFSFMHTVRIMSSQKRPARKFLQKETLKFQFFFGKINERQKICRLYPHPNQPFMYTTQIITRKFGDLHPFNETSEYFEEIRGTLSHTMSSNLQHFRKIMRDRKYVDFTHNKINFSCA